MELIAAMFILAGWYAYKHFKSKKSLPPIPVVNVEEESLPLPATSKVKVTPETSANECDFCQGEDIFIAGTKEKMPCPKCRRGMKIS